MGDRMRCQTCEEPLDVLDCCEVCNRYNLEGMPPKQTGQTRSVSPVKGVCIRGHAMRWAEVRWRCKPCEAMYAQNKRMKRKADR
jgi:hypothetical protein